MPREKKDAVRLNCKLDRVVGERLEKYCDVKGQTKTMAVERILTEHFDKYDQCEEDPDKRTIAVIQEDN